jgi:hypothetical protein
VPKFSKKFRKILNKKYRKDNDMRVSISKDPYLSFLFCKMENMEDRLDSPYSIIQKFTVYNFPVLQKQKLQEDVEPRSIVGVSSKAV